MAVSEGVLILNNGGRREGWEYRKMFNNKNLPLKERLCGI